MVAGPVLSAGAMTPAAEVVARVMLVYGWRPLADDASVERWDAWLEKALALGLIDGAEVRTSARGHAFSVVCWDHDWAGADRVGALWRETLSEEACEAAYGRLAMLRQGRREALEVGVGLHQSAAGFTPSWHLRGRLDVELVETFGEAGEAVASLAEDLGLDEAEEIAVYEDGVEVTFDLGPRAPDQVLDAVLGGLDLPSSPELSGILQLSTAPMALTVAAREDGRFVRAGMRIGEVTTPALMQTLWACEVPRAQDEALAQLQGALDVAAPDWIEAVFDEDEADVIVTCRMTVPTH